MKEDESPLIKRILQLMAEYPRFGYRRIMYLLRSAGWRVNVKRVYRPWRQEGLEIPKKTIKRRRLGSSEEGIVRRRAEHKDHVWSVDFICDRTTNGCSLKMLVIIDEFTRECITLEVSRKLSSDDFIDVLVDLFAMRGVPKFIWSDNNGPEFIARRVRGFLESIEVGTSCIEPGSPWQNGYVESFNSNFRDECLNCEEFTNMQEERVIIKEWRQSYNHCRPHGSLDGLTTAAFASRSATLTAVAALPTLKRHSKPEPITRPIPS